MNKVILTGRLTADSELRQSQNGKSICRFTVAVNRSYKNDKGEYDADFISCTAFGQKAQFISQYFNKGSLICIEGELRTGKYNDKQYPDVTHYTTDVFVSNAEFCGGRKSEQDSGQENRQKNKAEQVIEQAQSNQIPTEYEELLNMDDTPF